MFSRKNQPIKISYQNLRMIKCINYVTVELTNVNGSIYIEKQKKIQNEIIILIKTNFIQRPNVVYEKNKNEREEKGIEITLTALRVS